MHSASFDAITGGSFLSDVCVCIKHYAVYYIFYYHSAFDDRDSEAGRTSERWRRGKKRRLQKITRYLSVILALVEAIAMAIGFGRSGYLDKFNVINVLLVVTTLTAGSTILMWIGERITERGVGNGISIVLTINIISRIPADLTALFDQFIKGKTIAKGVLAADHYCNDHLSDGCIRSNPSGCSTQDSGTVFQKIQGRKQVGGQSTYIPLKVNTAGVIPVIFAQSLMQFPVVIATIARKNNGDGVGSKILKGLSQSNWCNPDEPIYSIGLVVYIILLILFAYFYTSITFNPLEIANGGIP